MGTVWLLCPRCSKEAVNFYRRLPTLYAAGDLAQQTEVVGTLDDALGLVAEQIGEFYTFREDFDEIETDEGTAFMSYLGRCEKCGLEARIDKRVRFLPERGDDA